MNKKVDVFPADSIEMQVKRYLKMIRDLKDNDVREEYLSLKKKYEELEKKEQDSQQKENDLINQLHSVKESLISLTTEYTSEKTKWLEEKTQLDQARLQLVEEVNQWKEKLKERQANNQLIYAEQQKLQKELLHAKLEAKVWKEKLDVITHELKQLQEETLQEEPTLEMVVFKEETKKEPQVSPVSEKQQEAPKDTKTKTPLSLGIASSKKRRVEQKEIEKIETPVTNEQRKPFSFRELQGKQSNGTNQIRALRASSPIPKKK